MKILLPREEMFCIFHMISIVFVYSTNTPTANPTSVPSLPSMIPTIRPSTRPSAPTTKPSTRPTIIPSPTKSPTTIPSYQPTTIPTTVPSSPTILPSTKPSSRPTSIPSNRPSAKPSIIPSAPSRSPTRKPSSRPTSIPSNQPSAKPSMFPSAPTKFPTTIPSARPTELNSAIWKSDIISLSRTHLMNKHHNTSIGVSVSVHANGPVYKEDIGHFYLEFEKNVPSLGLVVGVTPCLNIMEDVSTLYTILAKSPLKIIGNNNGIYSSINLTWADFVTIKVNRQNQTINNALFSAVLDFIVETSLPGPMNLSMSTVGCPKPRTIRAWDDPSSWVGGIVPDVTYDVHFQLYSGVAVVKHDVSIRALHMSSGLLLLQENKCPHGFTPMQSSTSASLLATSKFTIRKCIALIDKPLTKTEAAAACVARGMGFNGTRDDAHLIQIENALENRAAQQLCKGSKGSFADANGCWIGLSDPLRRGVWQWDYPITVVDDSYRDWRRGEPNNLTVDNGYPTNGGTCAHSIPWRNDPLISSQGLWDDGSCDVPRAALCEVISYTTAYVMNVRDPSSLTGGGVLGGSMRFLSNASISEFTIDQARIVLQSSASIPNAFSTISGNTYMQNGAVLQVDQPVELIGPGLLGFWLASNATSSALPQQQPTILLNSNVSVICNQPLTSTDLKAGVRCRFDLLAAVFVNSKLSLQKGVVLDLLQGGDLSQTVLLSDYYSELGIAEYAVNTFQFDAFEVWLSHRGPVIEEYYNVTSIENFESMKYHSEVAGVYRLQVAEYGSHAPPQKTSCVAYNASSKEMEMMLEQLQVVQKYGGVSIRRYGDGSEDYNYGFRYRIDFDGPPTDTIRGGVLLSISCWGTSCNCAETGVSTTDSTGQKTCPLRGHISRHDPNICILSANITSSRISSLRFLNTFGSTFGRIRIDSGIHRLPPLLGSTIFVTSGIVIVNSDVLVINELIMDGNGRFLVSGIGWQGWDAANLLYIEDTSVEQRGLPSLNSAPVFLCNVTTLNLFRASEFLFAGPNSTVFINGGNWNGGVIGGLASVILLNKLACNIGDKQLRYGVSFIIDSKANMTWVQGDIGLYEGAYITVVGVLDIRTLPSTKNASAVLGYTTDTLGFLEPGRHWHGYYDSTLPLYDRTGWYMNQICGTICRAQSFLTIEGSLYSDSYSLLTLEVPVHFTSTGSLHVRNQGHLTIHAGGSCASNSLVDISDSGIFEWGGGNFVMDSHCRLSGFGQVLISGGEHEIANSVTLELLNITGGTVLWPYSRGDGSVFQLFGKLNMQDSGKLLVQPWSTTVVIHGITTISNDSIIQFPMIGVAAEAGLYDRINVPDATPRGNVTFLAPITWLGGTFRGKADFFVKHCYLMGGEKRIRSLAKLINQGHTEWGAGDIIMGDLGDFVNLATVQMAAGFSSFHANDKLEGTVIPVENGGDVFAQDYHSWDLDQGSLDYSQYVSLRTEFVSRAPSSWKETSHY